MVVEVVSYGYILFLALEVRPIYLTVLIVDLVSSITTVAMTMMLVFSVQVN